MRRAATTHYSILTRNKPGALARLTRLLADEGLSIDGMMIASVGKKTLLQFLAPSDCALRRICSRSGLRLRETRIFERKAPRGPDGLHGLVRSYQKEGLDVLSLSGLGEDVRNRMVLARRGEA